MSTSILGVFALACLLLATFPRFSSGGEAAQRRELADESKASGTLKPSKSYSCEDCCKAGKSYDTYKCSPPTSGSTSAIMTLNDFDAGGDGGDASECDGKFHKNTERIVALSTGWYSKGKRCNKKIRINAKGKSVLATVVDECDSLHGCDREHAFQPPCRPNVVDASKAVWKALGITGDDVGEYKISLGPMHKLPCHVMACFDK